ncbi:nucleotidyl transferase AbiEii/AbiGii toxin family protein [Actinomadura kijaniata]|uniref:nucleotidyl transferase AbiEii/AbiGii toxin family protein n=1 Tax=Actinomadura kijaniata TaxID=46161 RepID=UPI003F1A9DC3
MAVDHVLAVLAGSRWSRELVLRGSLPLTAWLGQAARQPGDLDWLAPARSGPHDGHRAQALMDGLVGALRLGARGPGGLRLDARQVRRTTTGGYDLPEPLGQRLLVPWQAGEHAGRVQIDVAFGPPPERPPVTVEVPRADGGATRVRAAPPELELAWKLAWLYHDQGWSQQGRARGKDLYDAVLLAERLRADGRVLPGGLLRAVLRTRVGPRYGRLSDPEAVLEWEVDWETFRRTHPQATPDTENSEDAGEVGEWRLRLALALMEVLVETPAEETRGTGAADAGS